MERTTEGDPRGVRPNLTALERRHRVFPRPLDWFQCVAVLATTTALVSLLREEDGWWREAVFWGLLAVYVVSFVRGLLRPQHLRLEDDALLVPGRRARDPDRRLPWEQVLRVQPGSWGSPARAHLVSGGDPVPLPALGREDAERLAERVHLARGRPG